MPRRLALPALLALLLAAWAGRVAAQATRPAGRAPDRTMAEVARAAVREQRFMGAVLVARGGTVLFDRAYGSADLEWGIPNGPTTRFRIASLTKQFTAAGILLLEARGRLRLSDPVARHLPDAPAAWRDVTLFHLLTHTAGIPNLTAFADFPARKREDATPDTLIARFRDRPLDFAPGSAHRYSNSGYILLGRVLERASGQPYGAFVREQLLAPLGMADTGVDSTTAILPRRARGYRVAGGTLEHADYLSMTLPFAAGNLYSTTPDLLRWQRALFGGRVVSRSALARMTTPFRDDYALGLSVFPQDGHTVIRHGGGIDGFAAAMAYYPDADVTVIVLSNVETVNAGRLARELATVALRHRSPRARRD